MLKALFKSLFSARTEAPEPKSGEAWLARAKTLQRAGEQREAVAAYREALARGARAPDVHLQLGVLHAALFEQDSAVRHLEQAIALQPDNADALCMLGTVMSDLGRFKDAAAVRVNGDALAGGAVDDRDVDERAGARGARPGGRQGDDCDE